MNYPGGSHGVRVVFAFAAAILMLGACQRAPDQPADAVHEARVLTFTEAFRIGDEAAGDTVLLANILGIAVDSKGLVFVTDTGFMGIRLFTSDGVHMANIGREGRGPGEFLGPPSIRTGPGDSLYAWDFRARRLSILSPKDQSFVASLSLESHASTLLVPFVFLGAVDIGFIFLFLPAYGPGSEAPGSRFEQVRLVDWNGRVVYDSVAHLPTQEGLVIATENTVSVGTLPYAVGPHFALSTEQVLYFGSNNAIRITGLAFQGSNQLEIAVPYTPVPVTDTERDSLIANTSQEFRELLRERLPEIKPAFTALLPDDEGNLWIELTQQLGEEAKTWLVVDRSGRVAGRASVPQNVRLRVVRGNRAYGTTRDEQTQSPMVVAWDISS